jgi:hypothetical protein
MAKSLLRTWECISDVVDATASMTTFDGDEAVRERARADGIAWVSPLRARTRGWDVIVMADHMTLEYAPSIPKVMVGHGVGSTRVVRGGVYRYDRQRVLDSRGRPVYALMLDASDATAASARQVVPECRDVIRVVGNLDTDDLLGLRDDAARTRKALDAGDRVLVVVMSGWGPHALVPRYGDTLLPELARLAGAGEFSVVLTMHQNLWSGPGADGWGELVRSFAGPHFHVVGPDEDAGPFLAAADVAVADHTSYAAKFAVLDRPIVPVDVPVDYLAPGGLSRWLVENHRPVRTPAELTGALRDRETYRLVGAPQSVSKLGQSTELVRAAFLELLPERRRA